VIDAEVMTGLVMASNAARANAAGENDGTLPDHDAGGFLSMVERAPFIRLVEPMP
jgi:hypothetical protein